jgi:hypothetical protein
MSSASNHDFQALVARVAAELASTEPGPDQSCLVRTPLIYPTSNSTVVIRVDDSPVGFQVSDMGLGYEEAELMGAAPTYQRQAKMVAEQTGVGFDQHSFFVLEVPRGQLAGAIASVANCSVQAVTMTALRVADRKAVDAADELYDRLVTVFAKQRVRKNDEFPGASNTVHRVSAVVRGRTRPAVFEVVQNNPVSVAFASAMFGDIARLEQPPSRIAVVRNKAALSTRLGLIAPIAKVIEFDAPKAAIERLAA